MNCNHFQTQYASLNMYVSKHIKSIRESRQLTQCEVAAMLSMTRQSYSKLENNMTVINIDHIERLYHILHAGLTDLFPSHMLCLPGENTSKPSTLPPQSNTRIPMSSTVETKELLRLISGFAALSSAEQKAILEFIDWKLL